MDREAVAKWLAGYIEAWKSYDPQAIGDLFSEDAEYRYHPWDEPERGRATIVANWLRSPDAPGTWAAHYGPLAIDGDTMVATGRSTYFKADRATIDKEYHNIFIIRFDAEGRCASFTEWYMEKPQPKD